MPAPVPLISIITPSLNQGRFLAETIASLRAQDYPNIEHLVIDGGSKDNTLDILQQNETEGFRWISEPDEGTSEAINKGFSLAKGCYVWILNTDDRLAEATTLSQLASYLDQHPEVLFVYGDMEIVDGEGQHIGTRSFPHYDIDTLLTDRRHLPFPGCLMRRQVLDEIGGFSLALKYSNDLDFFLRLAFHGQLAHLPRVTGIFRIHPAASTQSNVLPSGKETVQVCNHYLAQAIAAGRLKATPPEVRARIALFDASIRFHSGEARDVRQALLDTAKAQPLSLLGVKFWLYLLCSLAGTRIMHRASQGFRALIRHPLFYKINNLLR